MTRLEDIERDFASLWRAIAELSSEDLAKLHAWLEAFEDRQLAEAIERDGNLRQGQARQAGGKGRGQSQARREPRAARPTGRA